MNSEYLERLKILEIEMFLDFIRICQKYELRYFALGGTCLGTVRHQGFIPWDDDIDIGMPRKDYNRFLEIAQEELPSHLFVQNYKTEVDFLLNFSKIRNGNTTFIEKTVAHMDINHGIYIDIFPLDGVPKTRTLRKLNELYINCLDLGIAGNYLKNNQSMKIHARIIKFVFQHLYTPYKLHQKINALLEKYDYDKCELVRNYFGAWGKKEMVPRKYFGKGCMMDFQNIPISVPSLYDKYLTHIYGDYMTLPPIEKRVSHHETLVVDLENSYEVYANEREAFKGE